MSELAPYLILLLVGVLPNEFWRMLGLGLARGLDETSQVVLWSRAVATAILAGVVAKLIFFAPGDLASVPLAIRVAAAACGFAAYLGVKRSVFAGVMTGEAILVGAGLLYAH